MEGSSLNLSVAQDIAWHISELNIYRIYKYIVSDNTLWVGSQLCRQCLPAQTINKAHYPQGKNYAEKSLMPFWLRSSAMLQQPLS